MRTVDEIKADIMRMENQIDTAAYDCLWHELYEAVTEDINLSRLEEICAAERDGRCVTLPCKEGDAMFTLSWDTAKEEYEIRESVIKHVRYDSADSEVTASNGERFGFVCGDIKCPGTRAFITRAAAEQALKEREDNA